MQETAILKRPYSFESSLSLGFTQKPLHFPLSSLLERVLKYFIWLSMQVYSVAT
jgi:hypothetical protein